MFDCVCILLNVKVLTLNALHIKGVEENNVKSEKGFPFLLYFTYFDFT